MVSPWIVQHEALLPFACPAPEQVPTPLPYLAGHKHATFSIALTAHLQTPCTPGTPFCICRSNFADVYWTFEQMLAHHTLGGCNIRAGDIMASGTISSPAPADVAATAGDERSRTHGCLLEATANGQRPLQLAPGVERRWLQDGDTVQLRAVARCGTARVGFGPCDMLLLPARDEATCDLGTA